jgi:LuxR family maltose regulon positive regulatory protein
MVHEGIPGWTGDKPGARGAGGVAGNAWRMADGPTLPSPVAAKLSRPRVPPAFVPRPRLISMLDGGAQRPVTLISAGAGWGKTLLVSSWAETGRTPGPVGWLSLGEEDDSPSMFWSNVVAALRAAGAVPEKSDLANIGAGLSVIGAGLSVNRAFIEWLGGSLARLPGPVVLVLDDLHAIHHAQVLGTFGALLRYQPEQLRLLLLARTDPTLPLHRLRAAGLLTEIRDRDLEFTEGEAAELLTHYGLHLPEDELRILLDRTEGWAAGLRLAAIHLTTNGNQHTIAGFTGDKGAVADYLIGEVFARQTPEVRRFLLHTSIVDQLSGDLADAITGGNLGQAMLEQLERANAFVVGLGTRREWFHYHHLLSDLLRHLLRVESPEVIADLHLRAAEWYSGHNAYLKAVTHAAAAADWPLVGRLIVTGAVPLMLTPDREAVVKVLQRVPPAQFAATAELKVCAAMLMFHARDYDGIPRRIAEARLLLLGRDADDRLPVEIVLRCLDILVGRIRGDVPAVIAGATEVLRQLTDVSYGKLPTAMQYRAIALNSKGIGLLWTAELDRADHYLRAAVTAARVAGIELTEINATGHLAVLQFMRGSLREAREQAASGLGLAERRGWTATLQAVAAYLVHALVELEQYHIAEAEKALKLGFDAHNTDSEAAHRVTLRVTQARLLLATGRHDAARSALRKLRQRIDPSTMAPVLVRWLALTEAEVDLASGHPQRVRATIGRLAEDETLAQRERVCLARADLALGATEQAEALLAPVRDTPADLVAAVEAWVVTALLAEGHGRGGQSFQALVRAVAMAEPETIRRPFLVIDRRRMLALIERHRLLTQENSEFVNELLAELKPNGPQFDSPPLTAELSSREMEVLRYLPTMFNAGEIADELHVSVNTVKAHLRSIYRKLDVSRRREAVVRARGLGLLR